MKQRDPNIASVLSVIPGLGFLYAGRIVTGIINLVFGFTMLAWFAFIASTYGNPIIPIVLFLVTWIFGIIDSRRVVIKQNKQMDAKSL